jgi:uncharacterized LabA/DUF88 family protein
MTNLTNNHLNHQMAVFIDFENVALWAEREFIDFEVTPLIEYLQSRGPAVVKRAYGDWSRFSRYRDELMNNSIDLIQIYSVRQGKNRADIRMAIDALEISMTRPLIDTYVIVSGDSDFSPLVAKLREYSRYTLGIGPRSITHHLLVKSCDEFVYLETALGTGAETAETSSADRESARALLLKATQAHGARGELPVLATRLKQTMLLMDPAFNEANFGYSQFKTWLEDNRNLVKLFVKDLQLYVAPLDYTVSPESELVPAEAPSVPPLEITAPVKPTLETQYRLVLSRVKMGTVDLATRRDILRDIYRELVDHPGTHTIEGLLDVLQERYEAQGLLRTKAALREMMQMATRQAAFEFPKGQASLLSPVWIAPGIDSEAVFVGRAESDLVFALIRAGLEIDLEELAYTLLADRDQGDYIQCLIEDLKGRGVITRRGKRYFLAGRSLVPFEEQPTLEILVHDIENCQIPEGMEISSEMANSLAKKAMVQRSQDFAASGSTYLLACRLQWEAIENSETGATLEDLRWFMASYASAIAGKLSQVNRDYAGARPYYLAFFTLVQEDDPLWGRMRGLINPMLSYYWANAARELELNISAWNPSMSSPAQIAIYAATHPNAELRKVFWQITAELAKVNPGLLRRIQNQIAMNRSEGVETARLAEQLEAVLNAPEPVLEDRERQAE